MQAGDTIQVQGAAAGTQPAARHLRHQPTPREVLSWLPRSATPAQMDSAIRQHIKPSPIHWSSRPDTLHLPGHQPGKSLLNAPLPKYYKESFFSGDSLFHPELTGGRMGVAGDPVPYTVAGDNLITGILIASFILAAVAFSQSRRFIARQAKNFFYVPRSGTTVITETSGELRFQLFLVLQTCLMLALGFFFYTKETVSDVFIIGQYQVIGLYTGVMAVYFLLKAAAYSFTDWVFFGGKKNEQWIKAYLFIISMEGVLLFPLVLLQAFFALPMNTAAIMAVAIVVLFKLLSLYKTYLIFFRKKGAFMQIFLYFCALEVVPLLSLWGALVTINGYLKINF